MGTAYGIGTVRMDVHQITERTSEARRIVLPHAREKLDHSDIIATR